ncbi:MAG: sugar-binding protein [Candidatus Hydrogenedentes bacterium]|nr:sugar-binding protein [Candidatus Hydrogenedentota bacterium]
MKRNLAAILVALAALAGCGGAPEQAASTPPADGATPTATPATGEIRLAYVTNGIDPFWTIAEAGVNAAAKDLGVSCETLMPPKGIVDQKRMVETLLSNGVQGIAISPIDAANQVDLINQAAKITNVITQDSDAPGSNRLCFIGMDNYKAGRAAGKLVKEALPDGGGIMIFVGRLEQLNAQQRRQGVIDELLDRNVSSGDQAAYDPPGFTQLDGKYKILGTRTDNFDYAKAKSNAEDAIASYPDLACMAGLFAYNIPSCLEAVKSANKIGAIKLVSFDEQDPTLNGIKDGHVQGTISQQPYEYGYQSVKVLTALAKGDNSLIPESKFIDVPIVVVTKENVEAFHTKLNELKGG